MVRWLPLRQHGYLLPLGCDQLCQPSSGRPFGKASGFLDQHQRQRHHSAFHQHGRRKHPTGDRASGGRGERSKTDQSEPDLPGPIQEHRQPLERPLRHRIPYPAGGEGGRRPPAGHPQSGDPSDFCGTDSGLVSGGSPQGHAPAGRLLRLLPQRGRPYSRGAVRGLSGQNHQRPGCRGQEGTEGELLPRSSSGPAESPGGLGPQFQRRGRGGLQRHSGRGRGWNHGHCDRGQIRRGRGSGESLSGGAGADRSEGVRGGAAPKRRGEHPQIRHSLL